MSLPNNIYSEYAAYNTLYVQNNLIQPQLLFRNTFWPMSLATPIVHPYTTMSPPPLDPNIPYWNTNTFVPNHRLSFVQGHSHFSHSERSPFVPFHSFGHKGEEIVSKTQLSSCPAPTSTIVKEDSIESPKNDRVPRITSIFNHPSYLLASSTKSQQEDDKGAKTPRLARLTQQKHSINSMEDEDDRSTTNIKIIRSRMRQVQQREPVKNRTCRNCATKFTPMWRKCDFQGKTVYFCNACALRYKKGTYCPICMEVYYYLKINDKDWIECVKCHKRTHRKCLSLNQLEISDDYECLSCLQEKIVSKEDVVTAQTSSSLSTLSNCDLEKKKTASHQNKP